MLNGESISARVTGAEWIWIATTERVVRFRKTGEEESSSKETETIEDVSYGEVTSIRMASEEQESDALEALALMILGLAGVGVGFFGEIGVLMLIGGALLLFGFVLALFTQSKKEAVLRLDGTTVLSEDWDRDWTLQTEDVEPEEVAEFMKTVRKRAK